MAQCVGCRRWGFRDDAPPEFFGRAPLEKHMGKLNLDERGLCDQCRRAQSIPDSLDLCVLYAKQAAEKVIYFIIPSEARNLSLLETQEKERFLGAQRASE
jgi:hypothetical protein